MEIMKNLNKKYEIYIDYIANDIKPPYIHNMREMYGLRPDEYPLILSRVYKQPVVVRNYHIYDGNSNVIYYEESSDYWIERKYDSNDNKIYQEDSDGNWSKTKYDEKGRATYYGYSDGSWVKKGYDSNENQTYYGENSGYWYKREYDDYNNEIYFEDSDGNIVDKRRKYE